MITEALGRARESWSRIVDLAYPLYGSREVVVLTEPKKPEPVEFYTDQERIFVGLYHPAEIDKLFRSVVVPVYGRPEADLWFDTLVFILFHELYHPLVCPNSREDERAISHALYRGIKSRLSGVDELGLLRRVDEIKNLVWDLVVNVSFLGRMAAPGHNPLRTAMRRVLGGGVPPEIVPAMYYLSAVRSTTDILITILGAFYAELSVADPVLRNRLLDGFRHQAKRLKCPKPPEEPARELMDAIGSRDAGGIERIFDDPKRRYPAVEAVGAFLAPFLRGEGKQGSFDAQTRGQPRPGGGGDVDTLQDLLEEMDEKEAEGLLQRAAQPDEIGGGDDESPTYRWNPLTVAAADEYYKRHSDPLSFRNPENRAVAYDLGKQKRWRLRNAQNLTIPEVAELDVSRVLNFQKATGLPVLMNLTEGIYQLNEYVLEETPIRTYTLRAEGLEIPDAWVLIVDSSGSMANPKYVGTGSPYDILMRVCYGLARGLDRAARAMAKDLKFGVVNFSDSTHFSGLQDFRRAFGENYGPLKRILLEPECGGTTLDVKVLEEVERQLPSGRVIYTLITDGAISSPDDIVTHVTAWSAKPNRSLLFVEVNCTSELGKKLRTLGTSRPSVTCLHVGKVEEIGPVLGSVLVRYAK